MALLNQNSVDLKISDGLSKLIYVVMEAESHGEAFSERRTHGIRIFNKNFDDRMLIWLKSLNSLID